MKKIFLIFFLLLISLPVSVNGEGLVPCGPGREPCQFCHIFVLFSNVVDFFLFEIIPPLAVLIVVIGGIMFFTSSGDPAKINKARSVLTTLVIGLVIMYCAWVIVNTFFVFIGLSEFGLSLTGPGKWFKIQCP